MYTNFVKLDYIEFLILRNWEQSYLWSSGIGPLVEWNLACADGGMERCSGLISEI